MTKSEALHAFFSQFMTAYADSSVPEATEFPWLTYEMASGSWWSGQIALTVNLWFYTESEAVPDAAAQKIVDAIGCGHYVAYDGGAALLLPGSPEWQRVKDDSNKNIKRRMLNITVEFLSRT